MVMPAVDMAFFTLTVVAQTKGALGFTTLRIGRRFEGNRFHNINRRRINWFHMLKRGINRFSPRGRDVHRGLVMLVLWLIGDVVVVVVFGAFAGCCKAKSVNKVCNVLGYRDGDPVIFLLKSDRGLNYYACKV